MVLISEKPFTLQLFYQITRRRNMDTMPEESLKVLRQTPHLDIVSAITIWESKPDTHRSELNWAVSCHIFNSSIENLRKTFIFFQVIDIVQAFCYAPDLTYAFLGSPKKTTDWFIASIIMIDWHFPALNYYDGVWQHQKKHRHRPMPNGCCKN